MRAANFASTYPSYILHADQASSESVSKKPRLPVDQHEPRGCFLRGASFTGAVLSLLVVFDTNRDEGYWSMI